MIENYDSGITGDDNAFAERIAGPLRSPERADVAFERNVMEKVREEGKVLYPVSTQGSWWRKERVVRISPLAGLGIAAGIGAIIVLSGVAIGTKLSPPAYTPMSAATTKPDTVQVVRFVFVEPRAARVELVGDFNAWARGTTELQRSGAPGVWEVSVPLSPGRHEYAFIINGTRWVADPLAVKSSDDFGTESSVIRVGTGASTT
ncbi:MAG TPA: isoamylase early set domain-containing protein [Gemmatimonadaceae bacterium]|jgi:hypothetical protein